MDFDDHHHRDIHHLHPGDIQHHHDDDDDSEEEEEEGSEELMLNNNISNSSNVVTSNNSNNSIPFTNNINSNSNDIAVNTTNNNVTALNNNSSTSSRARMVEALSQVKIHHQIGTGVIISNSISKQTRFRECQRNHALHVLGHAVDGCGEFMPSGPEGTKEAMRCAACNCHRNFHRKEEPGDATVLFPHHQAAAAAAPLGSYYRTSTHHHHPGAGEFLALAPPPRLALPSSSGGGGGAGGSQSGQEEDVSNLGVNGTTGTGVMKMVLAGSGVSGSGSGRKRFRTKFTAEQKEAMKAMAEEIGWKISKSEEEAVQKFCQRAAVKRHVFKVWMHNNKHTLGKMSCNNNYSHSVTTISDPRLSQSQ